MKASEIIKELVDIIAEVGDVEVAVRGSGDGSYFKIPSTVELGKRENVWRYGNRTEEPLILIR